MTSYLASVGSGCNSYSRWLFGYNLGDLILIHSGSQPPLCISPQLEKPRMCGGSHGEAQADMPQSAIGISTGVCTFQSGKSLCKSFITSILSPHSCSTLHRTRSTFPRILITSQSLFPTNMSRGETAKNTHGQKITAFNLAVSGKHPNPAFTLKVYSRLTQS